MDTVELIREGLAVLKPDIVEIEDESSLHAGHAGNRGGGHFRLSVVAEVFAGMSRIDRQRAVKNALSGLFAGGKIHALSIRAQTPDEYFYH